MTKTFSTLSLCLLALSISTLADECDSQAAISSLKRMNKEIAEKIEDVEKLIGKTVQRPKLQIPVPTFYAPTHESYYSMWSRQQQGISPENLMNYHQQVLNQRQQFEMRMQSGWSPQFFDGQLTNSLYGFGNLTHHHIETMYRFPQLQQVPVAAVTY